MRQKFLSRALFRHVILWISLFLVLFLGLTASQRLVLEPLEGIRASAESKLFDYVTWTLNAFFNKMVSSSLKAEKFMTDEEQKLLVKAYFKQVGVVESLEDALEDVLNQEDQKMNPKAVQNAKLNLAQADQRLKHLANLTEAVLQNQTERVLLSMDFGSLGQIIPPVLYQVSDLPLNLIVSPRDEIKTSLSLSLKSGMDAVEKNHFEEFIFAEYNHAALIEEVGGVGAYPTMVMRSNNINWTVETIAHEWIHNYLTHRPLGARYFENNAMRTINETTASLAGKEIGQELIKTYYREHIVIGTRPMRQLCWVVSEEERDAQGFDYRAEMRETRVTVDNLLARGHIDMAERYMEQRRHVFWNEGHRIRKLNQAYFAFYGSYNDTPGGGASGKDPIGPAVRALRYSQPYLKPFLDTIQAVRSFADLMKLVP